ncbi:unnamed protein product, partial [Bubo scandiacus]
MHQLLIADCPLEPLQSRSATTSSPEALDFEECLVGQMYYYADKMHRLTYLLVSSAICI